MTAYIAARFSRKSEMLALASLFAEHNIQVRARWLGEKVSPDVTLHDVTPAYHTKTATDDLEDIEASDTVIFFSEDPLIGVPRGGRHVEFGYALAKGKRVVVIGPPENTFHYLPGIINYSTVDDFLEAEGIQNAVVAD